MAEAHNLPQRDEAGAAVADHKGPVQGVRWRPEPYIGGAYRGLGAEREFRGDARQGARMQGKVQGNSRCKARCKARQGARQGARQCKVQGCQGGGAEPQREEPILYLMLSPMQCGRGHEAASGDVVVGFDIWRLLKIG